MAHGRHQIRSAVIAAVTGLSTTGANVFAPDDWVLENSNLPALVVATKREDRNDEYGDTDGIRARDIALVIEIKIKGTGDTSAALDAICLEVETAIWGDLTLSGLLSDLQLNSTDLEVDNEAEQSIAIAEMEWILTYQVNKNDLETIL